MLSVAEAAFGKAWNEADVDLRATSSSLVVFRAVDLVALKADFSSYGADLSYIAMDARYWDGHAGLTLRVFIPSNKRCLTSRPTIDLSGPVRVEIEGMGHSIRRSIESLSSKKHWSEVEAKFGPLEVRSDAKGSRTPTRPPFIKSYGIRTSLKRWFILHRGDIILGLGVSLTASILIILLQLLGIIPTPG